MPELHSNPLNTENPSIDTVVYMRDMLLQMQKLAEQQHLSVLAHLLGLAAEEARAVKKDHTKDTLPPG